MKRQVKFSFILSIAALLTGIDSSASSTLKSISTQADGQIELKFDTVLDPSQIQIEYLRDIVQISFLDSTIYPAKIMSLDTENVSKIFAYQYAPKLVRARFTVRQGKAEAFKGLVKVKPGNQSILVKFMSPQSEAPVASALMPAQVIQKVETKAEPKVESKIEAKAETKTEVRESKSKKGNLGEKTLGSQLAAGNPPSSPLGLKIGFAFIVFVGMIFFSVRMVLSKRKGKKKQQASENRLVSWTKRVLGKSAGGEAMIEVLSTQVIAPKKSISVVRIRGKDFVLAVSDDSMTLLSELEGEEVYEDKTPEIYAPQTRMAAPPAKAPVKTDSKAAAFTFDFQGILNDQKAAPAKRTEEKEFRMPVDEALGISPAAVKPEITVSARENIRQRLKGLKEL